MCYTEIERLGAMKMMYVFLANGFEELEAIAPVDILKRSRIPLKTVGVGGKVISGSLGTEITADITIEEVKKEDIEGIILPGGMPGTDNLYANEKIRDIVNYCAERNILIAAICAAPSILGKMGILENKFACCYPGFEESLKGAKISDSLVCSDKNIITAKGPGAATEFGFKILEYLKNDKAAEVVKKSMQFRI